MNRRKPQVQNSPQKQVSRTVYPHEAAISVHFSNFRHKGTTAVRLALERGTMRAEEAAFAKVWLEFVENEAQLIAAREIAQRQTITWIISGVAAAASIVSCFLTYIMKNGVHIIECLDHNDPGSEGRCLKHLFNLLGVKSKYERVQTISHLIRAMSSTQYKFIHISTHGSVNGKEEFTGWWTHAGIGKKSKLSALSGKLKCVAVISTACRSGSERFGKYVVDDLGSKHFIGPRKSPSFANAILFSVIFYHKLFITRKNIRKAFASYRSGYKNPSEFEIFRARTS